MRLLSRIGRHFRSLVNKERLDQELSEELRFHLERQVEEHIAAGMAPEDARFAALRELGGVEQIKEECRDMSRTQWFEAALQDARFAIRTFRKQPGFTVSVLAILALGIGSATSIFSIVNGVLLTALPYRAPEKLVRVFGVWEHGSREGISPPDFMDFRQRNTSFESMAGASIAPGAADFGLSIPAAGASGRPAAAPSFAGFSAGIAADGAACGALWFSTAAPFSAGLLSAPTTSTT